MKKIHKETRQIKDAFIDGFLSAKGNKDRYLKDAEEAWKRENTTRYPKPKLPSQPSIRC